MIKKIEKLTKKNAPYFFLTGAFWATGVFFAPLWAQTSPVEPTVDSLIKKTPAPVELWLKFEPKAEFAPASDTSVRVVCYVKNLTKEAMELTTSLGRHGLTFYTQGEKLRYSMFLREKEEGAPETTLAVEPGDTQIVFNKKLSELFDAQLLPRKKWAWDWRAQTQAPASPFKVGENTAAKANFWFSLKVNNRTYSAPRVPLVIIEAK